MGTKDLKLHCKKSWHVVKGVVAWRYGFNDLMKEIVQVFFANGSEAPSVKIECQVQQVCISVVDNVSLTRCLLLGGSVIDLFVQIMGDEKCDGSDNVETVGDVCDNVETVGDEKNYIEIVKNESNTETVDVVMDDVSCGDGESIDEVSEEDCCLSTDEDIMNEIGNDEVEDNENEEERDSLEQVSSDQFSNVDSESNEFEHAIEDIEVEMQLQKINRINAGKWFTKESDGSVLLCQGQLFVDIYHFRETLREFIIQEGFEVTRVKNEKSRVTVVCKANDCPWRVRASPTGDGTTFKIKTYTPKHNCLRKSKFREATYTWIAKKMIDKFQANPNKSNASIRADLIAQFGISGLKPMKLFRVRQMAKKIIFGDHKQQYAQLRAYGELCLKYNPGSMFVITPYERSEIEQPIMFKRMFLIFDGVKKAFLQGCRPYFGINGCFLKGPYGGMILAAIALDGNNGVVPLAICIAETESRDSWCYFLTLLKGAIGEDMQGVP